MNRRVEIFLWAFVAGTATAISHDLLEVLKKDSSNGSGLFAKIMEAVNGEA